ncbi:MAG: SGNH/GDSL hydrolase family protein [Butyrivibrio sp.]|nr:SGNH/GDSL hydrolase family protein [Butyrivibrio sp.]
MTRKQILKSLIFVVLALWLILHLTYVLRTNGDVKDRYVGFYAEKKNTVDAVFIGSSPLPACIATPKIYGDMGITLYPISSNVQRPVATKYLVEETLKTQDPDLFIFEMRMWTSPDDYLLGNMAHTREVTDNMKYSVNRIKTINAMVSDKSERLTYYFDIFKYHSNWKTLFMWSQLRTFFYSYPEDMKGYLMETEVGPSEKPVVTSEKEEIPHEEERYLLDLLEYLEKKDKKALFVITPFSASEDDQKKINYLREFIESRGYDFLDMNEHIDEMGLDFETDIRDYGTHTNALGAEKATDFFEKYLKENYVDKGIALTTDHRGDKRYSSWDRAFERFVPEFEKAKETALDNAANGIYYEK